VNTAATRRWLRVTIVGSYLGASVIAARMALDAGMTWDEPWHLEYGNLVLAWFRSGFKDRSAMEYRDLYLYGGLFDLPAQWIVNSGLSPWGPYETRHVLTALTAVLGVVATHLTAARIAGQLAGVMAALTLIFTPTWVGHGFFNPKDVPFAAATAFVAYATVRIAMFRGLPRARDIIFTGVALGAALGVRPGGIFLCAFPLLAILGRTALRILARRQQQRPLRLPVLCWSILWRVGLGLLLTWPIMLSAWPWAQLRPFKRPLKAAARAARFEWTGSVWFQGTMIPADALPWTYLPTWFAITIPETYVWSALAILLCFLWYRRERPRTNHVLAVGALSAFIVLPLIGVLVARPVIYDAHRHFLFFWPPMAALCGVALGRVMEQSQLPSWFRRGVAAAWLLLALVTTADMVELHPYEYVYFNRMSGGLAANVRSYEIDYWGATYREGLSWIVEQTARQGTRLEPVRVAGCVGSEDTLAYYASHWRRGDAPILEPTEEQRADYYLAVSRSGCRAPRRRQLVHKVSRQRGDLLYVYERIRKHKPRPP